MTPPTSPAAHQRYLVHGGREAQLADFLAQAQDDADIVVLDLIGPPDAPHTAVLELDDATAQRLQQQFRASGAVPEEQLTIEPDRPLSLFDIAPTGTP
jgi:hypothetical protein